MHCRDRRKSWGPEPLPLSQYAHPCPGWARRVQGCGAGAEAVGSRPRSSRLQGERSLVGLNCPALNTVVGAEAAARGAEV